jgi:hypothetical protein
MAMLAGKRRVALVLAALGVLAAACFGCGWSESGLGGAGTTDAGAPPSSASGTVIVPLGPGGPVDHYDFVLTNGAVTRTGTQPGDPTTVAFLIPDVPAGDGFTVSLSGVIPCGGWCSGKSTPFAVLPGRATWADVPFDCTVLIDNGCGSNCPVWTSIAANPPDVASPGGSTTLTASAAGPDPAALAFAWSAPAGTITSATLDQDAGTGTAVFTCPAASGGSIPITLVVNDGQTLDSGTCWPAQYTGSVQVQCPDPGTGTDGGTDADARD